LITGANGFIGQALTRALLEKGLQVRMTGMERIEILEALGADWVPMGDFAKEVDWSRALDGVDAVVHLAGIAHRFERAAVNDWALYDQVNHRATRALAESIRNQPSIKRFLFASTVRVHGDPETFPVRVESPIAPVTPYDKSKADAEQAIRDLLSPDATCWAIVRPAMVYGPGNRGNMAKLEGLIRRRMVIPVGKAPNRRSFLYLGNLVDALVTYLIMPEPPSGRTWIIADGEVASTEDLVRAMAGAMGIKVRIAHLPDAILNLTASLGDLLCRLRLAFPWTSEVRRKLLGDFFVDLTPVLQELRWSPPFSLEEGILRTFGTAPK
jgi:nucleoside-diphosphate-sugar epimerase